MMIKAGIVGVTGYAGAELLKILLNHPNVEVCKVASRSNEGKVVSEAHPFLYGATDIVDCGIDSGNFKECDVVFLALPHGASSQMAKELLAYGVKVIDLGADFRLRDIDVYSKWYGDGHKWTEILPQTVYGLPEINRDKIKGEKLIANPGCYPTSIILGLAPLLKNNLVDIDSIVVDSKSGVSGAGKSLSQNTHYPDMNEGIAAYKVGGKHRHLPEIEQELSELANADVKITFTPHLTPMTRGILSTITVKANSELSQEYLDNLYNDFYKDEYFVRVRGLNNLPNTKWVAGSNFCDVAVVWDSHTNRINVVSAIDNLVKGASGQAVQNMNILFDLPENTGIKFGFMYP